MFHFPGDEAFPFSENLMKIFPGQHPKDSKERIFHYRTCRAHSVVENVFGLASSVFWLLHQLVLFEPEKLFVMNIVCLRHFLTRSPHSAAIYTLPGTYDYEVNGRVTADSWRALSNENITYLTFRGPCSIVIYSYNRSQRDALFLKFILVKNSACFGQVYCPSSGV